jgi:hypothetical protein
LVEVWQTHRANEGGAFGPSGIGDEQIFGLALLLVMMLTVYAFACTAAAALGAGLRLLWWRLRGEPIGARLGIFSGSNDPV